MLSKNMYEVLSCFPRGFSKYIEYENLLKKSTLPKEDIDECLNETLFPEWNYVRSSNGFKSGSKLFLTESGLAKVEAHEEAIEEHRIVKQSLSVAKIAMWVSVFSVLVSVISLVKSFL